LCGKVAKQQTTGPLQLPLNLWCNGRYLGKEGVATSIGHSPVAALIDPVAGSRLTHCRSIIKYCLGTYQKWYGRIIPFGKLDVGL
jgi:hypothetical protein